MMCGMGIKVFEEEILNFVFGVEINISSNLVLCLVFW